MILGNEDIKELIAEIPEGLRQMSAECKFILSINS